MTKAPVAAVERRKYQRRARHSRVDAVVQPRDVCERDGALVLPGGIGGAQRLGDAVQDGPGVGVVQGEPDDDDAGVLPSRWESCQRSRSGRRRRRSPSRLIRLPHALPATKSRSNAIRVAMTAWAVQAMGRSAEDKP
ncbi:hypothetical protein ACK8N7_36415 [Streptomyces griseobrunneus]